MSAVTNLRELARARGRILIVDDEKGPRESLRMILRPVYEVHAASDANEALDVLRTTPIDCMTLDLQMPGIPGEELMRIVRREFPAVEVIVITGFGSVESATQGLRYGICDYLQKPFDVVKVNAAVARAIQRQKGRRRLTDFLERLGDLVGHGEEVQLILDAVQRSPRVQRDVVDMVEELAAPRSSPEEHERARIGDFLEVLAETIESQHTFMHGHAQRTSYYAGLLADRLCLSSREQERVRIAAFLHDVGKIAVPTELIMRPAALAPPERVAVERHSEIGANLVEPLGLPTEITTAVRHHHEWWDGRGYPDGLHGDQIPLLGRIISVADAYDAMSSDRPYRRALAPEVVIQELRRFAGVQFDPSLVKEFLQIVETSDVELQLLAETVAARSKISGARTSKESAAPSTP